MAVRLIVGDDEDAFYTRPSGGALPNVPYALWPQRSGGTQYTDVLFMDDSPAGSGKVNGVVYASGVLLTGHVDAAFGAQLPDGLDVPGVWAEFDGRSTRVYLRARQVDGTDPLSVQVSGNAAVASEAAARAAADVAVAAAAAADATSKANAVKAASSPRLTPTATKTSAYTAVAGDLVPVDTSSGNVAITLPSAPADGARVAVKHVIRSGTNTVSVVCAGSDRLNTATGPTSVTLPLLNQAVQVQYVSGSPGRWIVVADDLPLSQLDARFLTPSAAYAAYPAVGAAPDPVVMPVWFDTAVSPPSLKVWNGSEWLVLSTGGGTTPVGSPTDALLTETGDVLTTEAGSLLVLDKVA